MIVFCRSSSRAGREQDARDKVTGGLDGRHFQSAVRSPWWKDVNESLGLCTKFCFLFLFILVEKPLSFFLPFIFFFLLLLL